ncbi:uncharacterized protein LOC114538695 [Dendronephthya gigantea]|uniref:uncharacterized protein LOC114538695 n=1 Tax=Dendronephthya gigantea TaxID=151771 RepID=UPI00106C4CF7|nr:uncharacterized protein LOC114538695 [Dendronephthya gigantea]
MSNEEKLETKLTQLKIAVGRTQAILDSGKRVAIRRHLDALQTIAKETNNCKRAVEAEKIANKEDLTKIDEWNSEIDDKFELADEATAQLETWLTEAKRAEKFVAQEEQLKNELRLHEKKLEMQARKQTESEECEKSAAKPNAKLPKLVMTKFDGSYMNWPKFWGQFTEAIDKSAVAPITKFTYLLELLEPKVKRCVEALPFGPEGYNRAKSILVDKYGKESEIVKCYIKEILDLPQISGANPRKIAEFYEKLAHCVQALETMGKLSEINGNVSMTLDKLYGIRGDLVRTDPAWESWTFANLTEALKQWVKRNPAANIDKEREEHARKKLYNARSEEFRPRGCVYCGDLGHKAVQCEKIKDVTERKRILAKKGLCFNCAMKTHRASECTSKTACSHCQRRHHTSICDQKNDRHEDNPNDKNAKLMTDGQSGEGIFPVVTVNVNSVMCRALIDSGAGSCYASAKLINALNIKPREIRRQRIDMLMTTQTARMELYDAKVSSVDGSYEMDVQLTKVDKGELLSISNPNYDKLIQRYRHLELAKIDDNDTKRHLPIHLILGSGEYARIKTCTKPLIGKDGEPVAEKTKLGWFVMSPGIEIDKNTMLMTQTSQADFERLCRMDVLGLEDTSENDQDTVYEDFKENLVRNPEGWYETNLPWKPSHPNLPSNETGSQRRLKSLVKRLERNGNYKQYNDIIQDQLEQGIIEPAPLEVTGKEFYIPHKGITKQSAETTKLRIVYDASASESNTQPSLNDCLNPGPPLQNLLWSILVRARFYPILLTGDLEKAFLQVRVKQSERDALRFHWRAPGTEAVVVYRFTRALFGLTCSPFLLGGVLNEHLKSWETRYPNLVSEIRKGLYVDDLITGGVDTEEAREKRIKAIEVFDDARFTLHKWHSNSPELEEKQQQIAKHDVRAEETTFAKQRLGAGMFGTKLLGLPWNKKQDLLSVVTSKEHPATTKRGALSQLAKVYDPLGLVSPTTLPGKLLYREMCESNLAWDGEFPQPLQRRWNDWYLRFPEVYEIPRTLTPYHQPILSVNLHAFGDASKQGVAAAVYAVVEQEGGTTQGLVCSKSRIAKRSLTIPRLELVAGHMAGNLVSSVETALGRETVTEIHCWLDSTVALYWINGQGEYRQFVSNRVKKIREHERLEWHHVPTLQNPADLGSRGGNVVGNELWQNGPEWLSDKSKWPPKVILHASPEANEEVKTTPTINALNIICSNAENDAFDGLMEKFPLRKTLRICAWVHRFTQNCRVESGSREFGPLNREEIEKRTQWWIKRVQEKALINGPETERAMVELNLQPDQSGILECRGRIEGEYPIYLPTKAVFTRKLVERAHIATLHGGVLATMAEIRERYWVPKLRRLVKQVRSKCHGCVRFRSRAYQRPPPGRLPPTRTQGTTPFQVLGVDFAGPIRYKTKAKAEKKSYLVLYACSLTRAVHLELLKSLEVVEFIPSLKRLIARRGRPQVIYSDNATTFKAAEKWLKQARKDERFHAFLADKEISWRFNLSRAPWWGGQFERLIGIFKRSFYKSIGNGNLIWDELCDVILDIEVAMNNRPLGYLEDDVEHPVLTPNKLLQINPSVVPEVQPHHLESIDLRKRAKQLRRCKESMWQRWTREYVRGLRKRHRQGKANKSLHPEVGDAVIIQDEAKNRNHWKMGIVEELISGRDGIVRGAKVRTAISKLERAIQHLYPLELSVEEKKWIPNPEAPAFTQRPKRDAAAAATLRNEQQAQRNRDTSSDNE